MWDMFMVSQTITILKCRSRAYKGGHSCILFQGKRNNVKSQRDLEMISEGFVISTKIVSILNNG